MIGLINDTAGRMEFCYNAEWRAVCANEWDMRDAKVVCRQMLNICRNQSGTIIYKYIFTNVLMLNC